MNDVIKNLNSIFVYTPDPDQFDHRDIYKLITPESFRGDCEDYAVTLLWLLAEGRWSRFWWWTLIRKAKFRLYVHRERKTQHMALAFDGQEACNITKRWHDGTKLQERGYRRVIALPATFIFLKFVISAVLKRF